MTKKGNFYCYDFASMVNAGSMPTSMGVIFNNNGNPQTVNLSFTGDACYQGGVWKTLQQCGFNVDNTTSSSSSSSSSSAQAKTRIYFKSTNYTTPNVHYFNVQPAIAGSAWPGRPMNKLTDGWFSYDFDTTVSSASIVFNNNTTPQTTDLQFTAPNNCYNNGVWQTVQACGIPSELKANAGVDRKVNINTRQVLSAAASLGGFTTATWTSPAWSGSLTGKQVITPTLTAIGSHTVTLVIATADGKTSTDTMTMNVVAATKGLPERPLLAEPLKFPITGNVSAGKYRFVKAFPNLDAAFPSPVLTLTDGINDLIYVVDKIGTVSAFPNSETVTANQVRQILNISSVVRNNHEMGLLSMAFDPQFAANGFIYVYYIYGTNDNPGQLGAPSEDGILERWTVDNPVNPTAVKPGSRIEILRVPQVGPDHKGGMMQFHPSEGYLYLSIGDGGYGHSAFPLTPEASDKRTNNNSQVTTNLLGTMIRIKPLVSAGSDGKFYEVPSDNPFIGINGFRPEIWSYGHRNPWRWSFDKQAPYTLWETEVGQEGFEEVNLIEKGKNYGWPVCEGLTNRGNLGGNPTKNCGTDYAPPLDGYTQAQGKSIIGGVVYRGGSLPGLNGSFIFGDYVSKRIWSIAPGKTKALVSEAFPENIASFGTDLSGETLFVTSYGVEYANQGARSAIFKVLDDNAAAAVIPPKLSGTGLFADVTALIPSTGVIEYDVNTHVWLDGIKTRHFISIPNDQTIGFDVNAMWDLPVGTVLVKHASIATSNNPNKPFTTSVLFRQEGGWQSANYRWNTAGTEADLVTESVRVNDGSIDNRQRVIQSASDCASCHVGSGSKNPLAVSTRQLNRAFNYQGVINNQLDVFNSIGIFNTAINNATSYDRFAAPDDSTAGLLLRAKSYLHTNCAHCHSSSHMDMRFDTALANMHLINEGGAGVLKRIKPGEPENSAVHIYQTNDGNRMPKGTAYTNPVAAILFADWIMDLNREAVQTGVTLEADKTGLAVNDVVTLTVNAIFDNGTNSVVNGSVLWASSNPAVIDVSGVTTGTGKFIAKSVGNVTLTATSGAFSANISFEVNSDTNVPTSLKIVGLANMSLISGETQQLVAVATVAEALTGVTTLATWSSNNNNVASVSASGVVTGGLTAGSATITAVYKGVSATFTITNVGQGQYVYFNKPTDWATPKAHIWSTQNGVDTTHSGAWSGILLNKVSTTYGGSWLRLAIPKAWANANGETKIIFSNNGANQTVATGLIVKQATPFWYDMAALAQAPTGDGVEVGNQIQVGNGAVNLSGSGNLSGKLFVVGTAVDINANPAGPGMKFVRWEGTGTPFLVNPKSASTKMVVGDRLSSTLLAVFDSIEDKHVIGREHYKSQGCIGCHGSDGTGVPPLADIQSKYTLSTLATYIAKYMPVNNPGACVGDCASTIAAMIMDKAFIAPIGVCNADSLDDLVPQDRSFRLLSTLEYNNSVRDLLGLTTAIDVTTGRVPADIPVNGFKTNANNVFNNDYAKGYVGAAEAAAAMVDDIYKLTPACNNNVTCFVQTFGKRAFRRPLSNTEVTKLVALHTAQGDLGLLTAILSSPSLLYRSEVGELKGQYYELTDYEVASLLSYTYWATTPDASLMTAADAGHLSTSSQISAKVKEMLKDPKAKIAFERFITGWLDLDKEIKVDLNASLKADIKAETIEFVKRTVFEGGTFNQLLTADYSYMTQQLAVHYGITWPGGNGWQRVNYTGTANSDRSGILGHASIMSIQSAVQKTHPVKRGLFVRRNLMCQDFPPPPLGAELKIETDKSLTVRERFEKSHVKDDCKACHQYIDGIGFGLENYNSKGLYVTTETTDNGTVKSINSLGYIGSLNSAETYLSANEPVETYQGMKELSHLIADSTNAKACYARQWYRYTRGQHEEIADSCTLQVFGKDFKSSTNMSLLDLMVQFTQTKNYILRK